MVSIADHLTSSFLLIERGNFGYSIYADFYCEVMTRDLQWLELSEPNKTPGIFIGLAGDGAASPFSREFCGPFSARNCLGREEDEDNHPLAAEQVHTKRRLSARSPNTPTDTNKQSPTKTRRSFPITHDAAHLPIGCDLPRFGTGPFD